MNKLILAAAALVALGSVSAQAADGRDASIYGTEQVQGIEKSEVLVNAPAAPETYIEATVAQSARSTH